MTGYQSAYDVGLDVLERLTEAFDEAGRLPATRMVISGDAIFDECCDGVLLVRPSRIYHATYPFPTVVPAGFTGEKLIAVELIIYTARCVPVIDDEGNAPPVEEADEATRSILNDAAIVWSQLNEGFGVDEYDEPIFEVFGLEQEAVPDQGGCGARETYVTIGFPCDRWAL